MSIQEGSFRLRRLMTVLIVVLWILLLLERFGWAAAAIVKGGTGPGLNAGSNSELLRRLCFEFVAACPEALYLLSLWWIREALGAFAKGDFYAPVISRMLRCVGAMLAAGALLNIFVVPAADRALGLGPGYWIAFDVTGVVLGALGLSLAIVARVIAHAGEMKAELDEIF